MKQPWQKKEQRDAKAFGANLTPRSGGLWFAKGDSKSDKFLIDSKDSKHNRFSITDKMWQKVEKEALLNNRVPILSVKFGDKNIELVALDLNDFIEIIENGKTKKD